MYGRITKFDHVTGIGVITSDEGLQYRFRRSDVANGRGLKIGRSVDFIARARVARDVIVMSGSLWTVFGEQKQHASHLRAGN